LLNGRPWKGALSLAKKAPKTTAALATARARVDEVLRIKEDIGRGNRSELSVNQTISRTK
jgi:hypothetical protein